jgi:hypothetical protein
VGQGHYPVSGLLAEGMAWSAASIAVSHSSSTLLSVRRQQTPNLPQGEPHQCRSLLSGEFSPFHSVQDHHPSLLLLIQ